MGIITKDEIISSVEKNVYISPDDLAKVLGVSFEDIKKDVKELLADYTLARTKRGRLALGPTLGFYKGILEVKQKGFAFLRMPEGEKDIFIPADDKNGAMNGEFVLVRMKQQTGDERPEGKVVAILSPHNIKLVGTVHVYDSGKFVLSDEDRVTEIFIPRQDSLGAEQQQKVVVELTKRADKDNPPTGKIVEILGLEGEVGVDILSFARRFGLKSDFTEQCVKAADALKQDPMDLTGRLDLRNEVIFTIDGNDAKDLDDAVSLKRLENGNFKLGVHIADVSNYVRPGTVLDKTADERGTSVYLVDRVIPMLPEAISNNLCSLNPHEDKLTLSCIMEVTPQGEVVNYDIANTVIKSSYRLTYNGVNNLLAGDAQLLEKYADIAGTLKDMDALAKTMRERRFEAGSLDFDLPEPEIKLGENGVPVEVKIRERGDAEKMIEEFMLKCNVTVAEHMYHMGVPFIYRIHEQPDADRVKELAAFLYNFGINLKYRERIYPKEIQAVLKQADETPYADIVNVITLRALKKAVYSMDSQGHFGLAADQYCHFTSPIRRYPDLLAHRIIKLVLAGKMDAETSDKYEKAIPDIAARSTEREKNAIDAERSVDDLKMAEYMKTRIGDEYDGIISGVTRFGLFVALENTIEGMVPLAQIEDDYYELNEKMYCVIGARTHKKYTLGEKVKIKVEDVNIDAGQIEFKLV